MLKISIFFRHTFCVASLIILLAAQNSNVYSQATNVKVKLSVLAKEPVHSTVNDVIGYDDNNFYLQRTGPKGYMIESYDNGTLAMKLSKEISPSVDDDEISPQANFFLGGKILLLFSKSSKKEKTSTLYSQWVDKNSLTLQGTAKLLATMPYQNMFKSGSFRYVISPDKNKLCVIKLPYGEKDANQVYDATMYDENLTSEWTKNFTLPYADNLFTIEQFSIDNSGNFYVLGVLYKDKAVSKKSGLPNYDYKIISYRNSGAEIKDYTLTLTDKFITDITFKIADDGKIICGGFYSAKGSFSIIGTCFFSIDPETEQILTQGSKEFGIDFLEQFMSDTKANKKKEMYSYALDNLIIRADGGCLLVAEQYYVYTTSYTSNGVTYYTTHYCYNHIIVVNVNPDLSIQWAIKIPKVQQTVNDGGYYSSYAFAITADKLYFVFNDNPKNITEPDATKTYAFNGSKSVAVVVGVDADGKQTKNILFKNQDEGVIMKPKVGEQVTSADMIIYLEKGKEYEVGKLTFE